MKEWEGMEAQQQEDVAHVVLFAFRRWSTGRSFNLNWCSLVYFGDEFLRRTRLSTFWAPQLRSSRIFNDESSHSVWWEHCLSEQIQ